MKTFKAAPIYIVGRLLPAAIGFAGIALYTRFLDPASFGLYALLLSTSYLVGLTGFTWLRVATLRLLASIEPDDDSDFLATAFVSFGAAAVAVGAVIVVGLRIYDRNLPLSTELLTAAAAIASAWFELNVTIAQARLKLFALNALQAVRAVGILTTSLLLIFAHHKTDALLGGFAAGNCIAFTAFPLWKQVFAGRFRRAIFERMFRFGLPATAGGLGQFITTLQRYLLAFVGGTALVGIFSAANDFAQQTVGVLIATATLAGQPLAYRARDRGSSTELADQMRTNARLLFVIGFGAAAGVVALAQPLATVYLGSRFRAEAQPLMILSAIHCFIGSFRASYFDQVFEIALDTRPIAILTGGRILLSAALSVPLILRFGAIGAAVATLAAEVVVIVVSATWARRVVPVPLPFGSFAKVALAATVMAAIVRLIPERDTVIGLAISVSVGTVVYFVVLASLYARRVRRLLRRPAT